MFYCFFFVSSHKHVCILHRSIPFDYLHLFYIYRLTCIFVTVVVHVCKLYRCSCCCCCCRVVLPLLISLVNNNKCVCYLSVCVAVEPKVFLPFMVAPSGTRIDFESINIMNNNWTLKSLQMNMLLAQLNIIVSFSIKWLLPLSQIESSCCSTWPNVESIVLCVCVLTSLNVFTL